MHSSLPFSWRSLTAAGLLALLAACGGSSSGDGSSTAGGPQPGPSTGEEAQALPKIYIDTEAGAPITSKEDYLHASLRIVSDDPAQRLEAPTQVKGRGNTTWGMPKKPYRLKLDQAAQVLGMPSERNWALLANYADKTLVRNKLAMELGEKAGLDYNPRSTFVELFVNDEYQGVYELFEHRKVGPNRVDIEELDPEEDVDADQITGGYFLEVEHRMDEDVCWTSSLGVPFCAKDPEWKQSDIDDPAHPSHAQYQYITSYVDAAEQTLALPGNAYESHLDADSAVEWYLVNELLRNNDAEMHSSVFLHKPRGGKLKFGPLWDFDLSSGNINYNGAEDPEGWHIRRSAWHSRLFDNTDFGRTVFEKWCALKREGVIEGLGAQVDGIVATLDEDAIVRNFQKWDILGSNVGSNYFVGDTYQSEVDYLKSWLRERAAWMDREYAQEFGSCPAN